MKSQHWWVSTALLLLFAATLLGLWWFQQQAVRPFMLTTDHPDYWQASKVEQRLQSLWQQLPATQQPTLMHFWNPDCLCNQVSQRHYQTLLNRFDASELRVVVVAPHTINAAQQQRLQELNGERIQLLTAPADLALPASPSLALFHASGKLGYFGAYGFGALCTVTDDQLFPTLVKHLQTEPYGPFMSITGDGCFCPWPVGDAIDSTQ